LLFVRRYAPAGSVFEDGYRAAGVFGVLATGFAILLGLIVFLAFTSYDQSRSGAETEALAVAQQYETAQFMPVAVRQQLGAELVCYSRSVINQEWPAMEAGTQPEGFSPLGPRDVSHPQDSRPADGHRAGGLRQVARSERGPRGGPPGPDP
jgi:hypothetical protein